MKKKLFITICMIWAPIWMCSAADYFFRTLNVKDGLADHFIRDIMRDSQGYLWFSTINGLSRYDGYSIRNYMPHPSGDRPNDIRFVRETADSTLWMVCEDDLFSYHRATASWMNDGADRLAKLGVKGTAKLFYVDDRQHLWTYTDYGLFYYDYSQKKILQIPYYSKSPVSHIISNNGTCVLVAEDYSIYQVALKEKRLILLSQAYDIPYNRDHRAFLDDDMNLWIYNSHSLAGSQWIFSLKNRQWRQLSELKQMGNVLVNVISQTNDGNIWVGTGNAGIHIFNYQNQEKELRKVKSMKAFMPRSSHISCLYLDENNTMWIGSAKHGVAYTDMSCPSFNLISTGDYEDVSSLIQDKNGNLWIGFDGAGVMVKHTSGETSHFSVLQQQIPSDIVTSLTMTSDGSIMAGTYGNGIAKFDGHRFIPLFSEYPFLKYVKAMVADKHGHLWVATVDRGVVRIGTDEKVENFTTDNSELMSNGILCLAYDKMNDVIYIGTSTGVSVYDCAKKQFKQIKQFEQLHGSFVTSLMICDHNDLFVGSRNGLWIYQQKDGAMYHLTTEEGLSHNNIKALAKSGNRVWASTDNGLTCITARKKENGQQAYISFPFLDDDGLHNVVFSDDAALSTADGTALMGSFTGYVSILSENMIPHYRQLKVLFTEYTINGSEDKSSFEDFTIHHNDNLSISVSAMVPVLCKKINYFYRFKGDSTWMKVPGNILHFVSLNPGSYVLQVKAELPGMMESEIAELPIKVLPPLWMTTPAVILYLLIIALIIYAIYRILRQRQEKELAIKQLEVNLKKYEMEEDKIRFFTNISHDLKTPLTLVVAPLEKIRGINLPAPIKTELDVAWRNARQLYDLVLQLLDFRKLDEGMDQLNLKHGDIVDFVRHTINDFSYYASRKLIHLQLQLPANPVEINFDENKMRRIITNLLSNACKYNNENGSVMVSLQFNKKDNQQQMVFNIADTGIGIKDKQHIFKRFMQETHGQEQEGSGLGLHIVKKYVDMMKGNITVTDNQPNGTVFCITLPLSESLETNVGETTITETVSLADGVISEQTIPERPVILVVEDNMDARLFLQRSLDDEYVVLLATNGKDALNVLEQNDNVNLVISDVMMPEMDGITFFQHIKGNIKYSHIPVIFLTAKSGEENIVAGLQEGVADYITKPYSLTVLRLRIKKILEWTQNVHTKVANGIEIKPSEITVSSLDKELIARVISHIEENIQNADYSVVQLSSAVGMTRGHLYKKLMAITGKSPLEFIRIIKIKRGKSLLDQGKTNISEVADMVGFSAKQFSHYFKDMYNETPSDYLKKQKLS